MSRAGRIRCRIVVSFLVRSGLRSRLAVAFSIQNPDVTMKPRIRIAAVLICVFGSACGTPRTLSGDDAAVNSDGAGGAARLDGHAGRGGHEGVALAAIPQHDLVEVASEERVRVAADEVPPNVSLPESVGGQPLAEVASRSLVSHTR